MLPSLTSSAGKMPVGLGVETPKGEATKGGSDQEMFANILSQKKAINSEKPLQPKEVNKAKIDSNSADKKNEKADLKSQEKSEKAPTKAKKAEEKIDEGDKSEEGQKKRAMRKFMDSMESEFGIQPTRIVDAMAQLSDSELQLPPEETASAVIEQLDLPPEQSVKAESMYMKMLADTQGVPNIDGQVVPEFFKPIEPQPIKSELLASGLTGAALMAKMSAADRRTQVNAGLEKMNNQFFVDNLALRNADIPAVPNELGFPMTDELNIQDLNYQPDVDASEVPMATPVKSTDDLTAALQALDRAAKGLEQPSTALATASDASDGLEATSALKTEAPNLVGLASAAALGEKALSSEKGEQSFSQDSMGEGKGQEFFLSRDSQIANPKATGPNVAAGAAGGAASFATQLARQDRQENIQKIMDKAQVLAAKGGGTMRLQMSPEGMGQIDLRVKMANGKMDLEVQTESKEAKRLLEHSLGELKNSLASQKIHVEHVKVDVGLDSRDNQQNMQQQGRQFGSEDSAKEQARQFLNQFRQGNSESRSGFLEMGGMKAYMPKKKEELSPIVETQVRKMAEHKGNGINLVA